VSRPGLPVAEPARVRRAWLREIRADLPGFGTVLGLNVLAALAGLVSPRLLGAIVDAVRARSGTAAIDRYALIIVVATLAQLILARYALYAAARAGERAAARIRERFLDRALALPASLVERAGAGDLLARGTGDVDAVSATLRGALPAVFIAGVQTLVVVVAVLLVNPLLGLLAVACLSGILAVTRWYLRRARDAYLAEGAANSAVAEVLASTADGARTVDTLSLQAVRVRAGDTAIDASRRARMVTLRLRNVLWPVFEVSTAVPVTGVLLLGVVLYDRGVVTLGAIVAVALYLRQLVNPMAQVMAWLDQLQLSGAAYARVEGLAAIPTGAPPSDTEPAGDQVEVRAVRYAYEGGPDVLRDVDLSVRPGERLALVGPSGAGKSTLGRLLAGIDRPRTGAVTVGGVPIADLPPELLRRQVVLVTQEHHVFADTLRGNLLLARPGASDGELRGALDAVGWPDALDLDTDLATTALPGAEAQQLALARVVLADPHTVILDEATAMLDPAAARNAERALAAVLDGRTVIAIAHRLQTARDADRVAVMDAGTITEVGTHDDLVAAGGGYATLWHSWHGD
jgi:ATP-binding cassette, subfamily C, bacterial